MNRLFAYGGRGANYQAVVIDRIGDRRCAAKSAEVSCVTMVEEKGPWAAIRP